jgi:hypothetical protein
MVHPKQRLLRIRKQKINPNFTAQAKNALLQDYMSIFVKIKAKTPAYRSLKLKLSHPVEPVVQ